MTTPTTIGLYDTVELVQVVQNLKLPSQFLLDTFFPQVREFDTKEVAIDVDVGKRRLAPFASPLVEGKVVEARRISTSSFAPAYVKDKRVPDVTRPVMRALGERIGGGMSAPEREAANLVIELEDQVQMVQRRLEWMAASALSGGTVTIIGDGYPTTVIDFQRDAALTVALTSTATWTLAHVTAGTAIPSDNVEGWVQTVLKKSGAVVTDIVFTNGSWAVFKADQKIKDSIWFPRSGESQIDLGGGITVGGLFKGYWGNYRLWLYNDWYVDPADEVEKPMLTDGIVILGSSYMQGVRAFGAIMDPAFAYGAMAFAPKSWVQQDPAQRFLMMQSAPITIPSRVNAAMAVQTF